MVVWSMGLTALPKHSSHGSNGQRQGTVLLSNDVEKKMTAMALLKRLCSHVFRINKGQRGHLNAPDIVTLYCIEKKWYAIGGIQKSGNSRFQNLL